MDIKGTVEQIVSKVKNDPNFMNEFQKDPEKAIEKISGIDIPDGAMDQVIAGIKAKMAGDKIGGAVGAIKNFF